MKYIRLLENYFKIGAKHLFNGLLIKLSGVRITFFGLLQNAHAWEF